MRPYRASVGRRLTGWILLLCSLVVFAGTAQASPPQQAPSAIPASAVPPSVAAVAADPLTRAGWERYYSLDYDKAVQDFERVMQTHPGNPVAINHLISALLFRALYRAGAMDTGLYSGNSFVTQKKIELDGPTRDRINQLTDESLGICNQRLKANPNDVDALYARGVARGMRATYLGLVEKSWYPALRNAVGARRDHERVLELDPNFADAKFIVGMHNYVVGSLPFFVKVAASIVGISGSKDKGLQLLREAAAAGGETATDARVVLILFLRREQRFDDTLAIVRQLIQEHPHNYLFALEEANVLNDGGHGPAAIAVYRRVLAEAKASKFVDPHLELAQWGLGEALFGQRNYADAAAAYDAAGGIPSADKDLRQRAALRAGQAYDVLGKRDQATARYKAAVVLDWDSPAGQQARKYLNKPYRER
jgi:tetratricopeptide (TPR) repeat protein